MPHRLWVMRRGAVHGPCHAPRTLVLCQPPACIASPFSCSRVRSRSMSASPPRCSRPARACRTRCGCAGGTRSRDRRRRPRVLRRPRPRRAGVGGHRLRPRLPVPGPRRPAAGRRRGTDRRPRPGRAARRHLHGGLRARRHGPARRQARHHALALHAGPSLARASARPGGRERAVRGRGQRAHLGRRRLRHRPVPAHPARRPRGGRVQPRGPASGRRPLPQRRPGPVRAAQRSPSRSASGSPPPASGRCTGSASPSPSTYWRGRPGSRRARSPGASWGDRLHADAVGDARPYRPGPANCSRRLQRSVEQIAADVGLGTGANLRLHFQRILGTTPSEYRRTFTKGE